MLMAKLSAETRFMLASYSDPAEAITRLNKRMHELDVGMFATFFCMIIDPSTSNVDIVNAGHMLPLWQTKPGHVEEPGDETVGVPLGVIEDFCYESTRIELKPHQRLVMFTDGIHEAPSPSGELFGLNRMRESIAKSSGALSEVGNSIVASVEKFSGATVQADDMCLVIVSRDS